MNKFLPVAVIAIGAMMLPVVSAAVAHADDADTSTANVRIDKYLKLTAGEPGNAEHAFQLGNAYYDAGMIEDAVNSYRKSWENGKHRNALLNLVILLGGAGKREEVSNLFREGLETFGEDAQARATYADFLAEGPDTTEAIGAAINEYRHALHLDSKCVEAHFGLGVLFARTGILQEAVREWEEVMRWGKGHPLETQAQQNISRAKKVLAGN